MHDRRRRERDDREADDHAESETPRVRFDPRTQDEGDQERYGQREWNARPRQCAVLDERLVGQGLKKRTGDGLDVALGRSCGYSRTLTGRIRRAGVTNDG